MNTYHKYAPNVFLAKTTQEYNRGDIITVTSQHGKETEHIIHNFIWKGKDWISFFYSITRADELTSQDFAKRKAERLETYQQNALTKSEKYYQASHEWRDFLSLAEPIKIWHHSEQRHRNLIERNSRRMDKAMELQNKADSYNSRIAYHEEKAKKIDLSMPESIEHYTIVLDKAKAYHKGLKDNTIPRQHSYSLTYANKGVKEAEKNLALAIKLWATDNEYNNLISK